MKKIRVLSTDEEIKIFSDPFRLRIIETYKNSEGPITAKEAATVMGEAPAKVNYHVKKLLSINILELDHIEIIKGIKAKYYQLTTDSFRVEFHRDKDNLSGLINSTESMLVNIINEFKEDVYKASESIRQRDGVPTKNKNGGMVSKDVLFLSEKDYKAMEEEITKLFKKYEQRAEGTEAYSMLIGIIKKNPK